MDTKVCTRCKEPKPYTDFGRDARHKDGLQSRCKACYRIIDRERNKTEQRKESFRKRRNDKREHINALKRAYYHWRIEQGNPQRNDWQRRNQGHKSAYDFQRYKKNRDSIIKRASDWYRQHKEQVYARLETQRAKRRSSPGVFTQKDIRALYKSQNGLCVYHKVNPRCKIYLDISSSVDHVTPLSRGGSNWPDNLQLLCRHCNSSKGTKTHEEYLAYLSRF